MNEEGECLELGADLAWRNRQHCSIYAAFVGGGLDGLEGHLCQRSVWVDQHLRQAPMDPVHLMPNGERTTLDHLENVWTGETGRVNPK